MAVSTVGAWDELSLMRFRVSNITRGSVLAERAERAETFWGRLKGLLGRSRLCGGEGLHITPCRSIHTFFMRFPIDVLFLDERQTVLRVSRALAPWRTLVCTRATSALELPAGAASGTQPSDVLEFELC
jgi:uncharacterized membrane protein (UPF0127 family)